MSYSRWSNSVFYTFWCSTVSKKKEDQLFDICGTKSFTYGELNDSIENCISQLKQICDENSKLDPEDKPMFSSVGYTDEEYDELRGYMQEFISDVNENYNLD